MDKNILVLGTGGSAATNFIRSLRLSNEKFNIVGTDSSSMYLKRSEADSNYLVPLCTSAEYIESLSTIIERENIDFIHIQNDKEIAVISENREPFEGKLFLPSKESVRICQNKFDSYLKWKNNVPQPNKFFISNGSDLKNAWDKLDEIKWIRETMGAGGRGSLKTSDLEEAIYWINKRNGWGKYEVSDYLSETSVTWSSIWKNGELIIAQGRKRLFWELSANTPSGVTGSTGGAVTINDEALNDIAEASILAIDKNPNGIWSVDLTYDKYGIPNPTEINPARFFTTILFFSEAGLNMPSIYVNSFFGKNVMFENRYNPLPNDYCWIRGIDFLPKLLTPEEYKKL